MSTKRKHLEKRKGGVLQKISNWVLGTEPPDIQDAILKNVSTDGIVRGMSGWNASHDDTALSGDRYVGGQCCRTVGEYKAACAKFYGT